MERSESKDGRYVTTVIIVTGTPQGTVQSHSRTRVPGLSRSVFQYELLITTVDTEVPVTIILMNNNCPRNGVFTFR